MSMPRLATWCLLLALVACSSTGQSPSASAQTPATPPAASSGAKPFVVLITGVVATDAPTYTLSIVTLDGQVAASATAANPNLPLVPWQPLPFVSSSASRAYYLDGNGLVKYLKPDGTTGLATHLPVLANQRAVFAVSPDDGKVAVSVFDLNAGMHLSVAGLAGSQTWHEIFATSAFSEWPVGWHGGQLALGLGHVQGGQQICAVCSWTPLGIHLVNPDTGSRSRTICEPDPSNPRSAQFPTSPPTPAGVLCQTASNPTPNGLYTVFAMTIAHWDGSGGPTIPLPAGPSCGTPPGALSPDGQMIASIQHLGECSNGNSVNLFDTRGHWRPTSAVTSGQRLLWIDSAHLCFDSGDDQSSILDVASDKVTPIKARGLCTAVIPGGLGS